MKTKWLLFTFLLLNFSSNVSSQYTSYDWNTTKLGVSVGDTFNFNLTEFYFYYSENDTNMQKEFHLNFTSSLANDVAPDEVVKVGDTFSISILSDIYFSKSLFHIHENATSSYEISIPLFNYTLSHKSFAKNGTMGATMFVNSRLAGGIYGNLFLIPDWEIYEDLYFDSEFYNETIVNDRTNIRSYNKSFSVGENRVTFIEDQLLDVNESRDFHGFEIWEAQYKYKSVHAIFDKNSGVLTRVEFQDQGLFGPLVVIVIENLSEYEQYTNFSLGIDRSIFVFIGLTSAAILIILTVLMIHKKGKS